MSYKESSKHKDFILENTLWSPPDKYVWDFWTVQKDGQTHLFYLQAPNTLSPEERHDNASIGHAVSDDLENWKEVDTALMPGEKGSWDDISLWTGGIVEKDGTYFMFYTSRSSTEDGNVQRIGVATSQDLYTWDKHSDPVIEADSTWYEKAGENPGGKEAWRDPFVFYNEDDGYFHAYITARVNSGPSDGRGCIADARSKDLFNWDVLKPVCAPGDFSQMEVPTLHKHENKWYLFFSTDNEAYSEKHRAEVEKPESGVFYYASDRPDSGFAPIGNEVLLGTESKAYTARVVKDSNGDEKVLTWMLEKPEHPRYTAPAGLAPPLNLHYNPDGSLELY